MINPTHDSELPDSIQIIKSQEPRLVYRSGRRLIKVERLNLLARLKIAIGRKCSLKQEYQHATQLAHSGIPTPRLIGYRARRQGWFTRIERLDIEYLSGALTLREHVYALAQAADKIRWYQEAIHLAELLARKGFCHLDFHHRNLLVSDGKLYLIDPDQLIEASPRRVDLLVRTLGRFSFGLRDNLADQGLFNGLIDTHLPKLAKTDAERQMLAQLYTAAMQGRTKGRRLRFLIRKGGAAFCLRFAGG